MGLVVLVEVPRHLSAILHVMQFRDYQGRYCMLDMTSVLDRSGPNACIYAKVFFHACVKENTSCHCLMRRRPIAVPSIML